MNYPAKDLEIVHPFDLSGALRCRNLVAIESWSARTAAIAGGPLFASGPAI